VYVDCSTGRKDEQARAEARKNNQTLNQMNTRVITKFTAAICICISFAALVVTSTEQVQQGFIRTTKANLLSGDVHSEKELNMDSVMLPLEDQELTLDPLTIIQLKDQEFWERFLSAVSAQSSILSCLLLFKRSCWR